MPVRLPHLLFFFAALIIGSVPASAYEREGAQDQGRTEGHPSVLVLENGDRITGREIKREGGTIHFESDLLGIVRIAEGKATVEPAPLAGTMDGLAATSTPPGGFPEQVELPPPDGAPAVDVPLPDVVAADDDTNEEPEVDKVSVTRQLEFGYTNQSGRRDRSDLSFRATIERRSKLTETRFQGRYLSGESDGKQTTDNLTSSLRFRRDLRPGLFAQSETKYERDPLKDLDNDFTQSFGMGRNLVERQGLKLAFGGGAAARYRDVDEDSDDANGWIYQVDAFQDLIYTINSHLKLTQDMSVQVTPTDQDENFLLKLNAALTSKLTNTLNMSMRYEYEYDASLAPDARENQRVVTSVGYAF